MFLDHFFWIVTIRNCWKSPCYQCDCFDHVLAFSDSFFVRIAFFSILLSKYTSHADRDRITNPRTLNLSIRVLFVPIITFLELPDGFSL